MIKPYQKDSPISYSLGFFPTIELLKSKNEFVKRVYISLDAANSEGHLKIRELAGEERVVISDKPFSVLKCKENTHAIGVFEKYEGQLDKTEDHLVLVNPSDMGNLGNAMRSLLAFSFHSLALIKPCADCYNPKVIRASMGAIFKINIEEFNSFDEYKEKYKREYYAFALRDAKNLQDIEFKRPCSLLFGNEATGLNEKLSALNPVKIEQSEEVDSLNLTTAIAIGLYNLKIK